MRISYHPHLPPLFLFFKYRGGGGGGDMEKERERESEWARELVYRDL